MTIDFWSLLFLVLVPGGGCVTLSVEFDVIVNASYLYRESEVDSSSSSSFVFIPGESTMTSSTPSTFSSTPSNSDTSAISTSAISSETSATPLNTSAISSETSATPLNTSGISSETSGTRLDTSAISSETSATPLNTSAISSETSGTRLDTSAIPFTTPPNNEPSTTPRNTASNLWTSSTLYLSTNPQTTVQTLVLKISFGKIIENKISTEISEAAVEVTEPPNTCFLPIGQDAPNYCIELSSTGKCLYCVPGFELIPENNTCSRCASGYYKNEFVNECTPCEAGKTTKNATGQDRCYACEVNTSTNGIRGSQFCFPCPGNSSAPKKGMPACTCYRGRGGPKCELCQPGSYSDSAECLSCGVGKYASGWGTWWECLNCSAGTYANDTGTSECSGCPVGLHNPADGQSSCGSCPDGGFAPQVGMRHCFCVAGYVLSNLSCVKCGIGKYGVIPANETSGQCTGCEAGKYSFRVQATECSLCPLGSYNDATGMTVCRECPAHSTSVEVGRTQVSDCVCREGFFREGLCVPCGVGTFQTMLNSTSCQDCEPGTFSNAQGAITCEKCPLSTYNPMHGRTSCFICRNENFAVTLAEGATSYTDCKCTPGAAVRAEDGFCAPCAPGTFQSGALCVACEAGKYLTKEGSVGPCAACSKGTYSSATGMSRCTECPTSTTLYEGSANESMCVCRPGSFLFANTTCAPCLQGTFQPWHSRNEACEKCGLGKYAADAGRILDCRPCPRGFYNDKLGRSSCLTCGDPMTTMTLNEGETSVLACVCLPGSYLDLNQSMCAQCPAGKYQSAHNASRCHACAPGKYSDKLGRKADCDLCRNGSYSDAEGQFECLECPAPFSTTQRMGSEAASECVCVEGHVPTSWGSCAACRQGSFQPALNGTRCFPCEGFAYTNGSGSKYCDMCLAGSSMTYPALICGACRPGTYQPLNGSTMCLLCPNNTFTADSGSTACSQCAPDTTGGRGSQTCTACPLNSYTSGSSKCRCKRGMIMDAASQTCVSCAPGTYQEFDASTFCSLCPVSTYTPAHGAYDGCLFCPEDTFNTCAGMSYCEGCAANSSTRGLIGSVSCKCNAGFVSRGLECLGCPAGSFESNNSQCVECGLGSYNPAVASSFCATCPNSTYAFARGSSACSNCTGGSFGDVKKNKCVCPFGYFNSSGACVPCKQNCSSPSLYLRRLCLDEADNVCLECNTACPPNFYISKACALESNIECRPCAKDCIKGYYRNKECGVANNLECLPCRKACPHDSIKTGLCYTRDFQCEACEFGKYPDPNSQRFCVACPDKHYIHFNGTGYECKTCVGDFLMNANKTGCSPSRCAPGEYPSGSNECSFCPLNTYSPDGQACLVCPPFYNCEKQRTGLSACVACESAEKVDGIQDATSNACPVQES